MKYKEILIFLLFMGIVFVVNDIVKATFQCTDQKVIYRFLPRTYDEEIENPVSVTDMYYAMFSQPSPWSQNQSSYQRHKQESINVLST